MSTAVLGTMNSLVAQEAAEEAAKARKALTGKALRAQLLKTNDDLKADAEAYRAKAEKDVGASKETVHTLGNIAKNAMHFIDMCAEWNAGKPGVRKTKIAYERLAASERQSLSATMEYCWRTRPYLFEGGLKEACLHRFSVLRKMGADPTADRTKVQTEIHDVGDAVKALNQRSAESQMDTFFPGHGGFRKIQEASYKVTAIERRLGGAMDKAEKYRRWPCLQPGWPDNIESKKLPFELEIEAHEKRQQQREKRAPSPSLAQSKLADQAIALAKLNDKAAGREEAEEEPEAGGYEGEQAAVFDAVFGDEEAAGGEAAGEEGAAPSPSLAAPEGPREEGTEDDGAGAIPVADRVDRRFDPEPAPAPVKRMRSEASIWGDAFAARDLGQSDSEAESEDIQVKKRRTEVYGLPEELDADDDEAEMTNGYY